MDCGACEPVCPVESIYYEDDVPDQWSQYTQINADFFAELGSPGGASKVGLTENDPQVVKDLPPRMVCAGHPCRPIKERPPLA